MVIRDSRLTGGTRWFPALGTQNNRTPPKMSALRRRTSLRAYLRSGNFEDESTLVESDWIVLARRDGVADTLDRAQGFFDQVRSCCSRCVGNLLDLLVPSACLWGGGGRDVGGARVSVFLRVAHRG